MLKAKAAATWAMIVADAETVGEQRAFALPRLRPYVGDKRTIKRLRAGFAVLIRGLLRLIRKGLRIAFAGPSKPPPAEVEKTAKEEKTAPDKGKKETPKDPPKATPILDWLEQAAIGLLALAIAAAVVVGGATAIGLRLLPYLPIITGVTIPGLLIAAWVVAPEPAPKTPPAACEKPLLGTPEGRRIAFLRWLEKTTRGTSGIHLDQMHRQLTQQEVTAGFPRHHLRPLLDHYQIPVKRTLRVGDVAGRSGVAREAIVQLLQEAATAPPLPVESEDVERIGESV